MTILSTNWKASLAANPFYADILLKLDEFETPFATNKLVDDVAKAYLEEEVPLIVFNTTSEQVMYFHHLKKFGGRRFGPKAKWGILLGLKANATPCEIKIEDFFDNLANEIAVPTTTKIWTVDTLETMRESKKHQATDDTGGRTCFVGPLVSSDEYCLLEDI